MMQACRSLARRHQLSAASRTAISPRPIHRSTIYRSSLLSATVSQHGRRTFASQGPSQQQVFESFGTPFLQFIHTLSRIARILVFSGAGIITVLGVAYEGTHMYVEYVAMPRSQVATSLFAQEHDTESDPWGWSSDLSDESWSAGGVRGTDPRLGWKGRHALRAAWMAAHWGSGISPDSLVSSSGGIGSRNKPLASASVPGLGGDGLETAALYLDAVLRVAEDKGIRVPDLAAIRAGIDTPRDRHASHALDETAIALEMKMASIYERLGSPSTLRGAIAGYTRLFDALANLDATNRAMAAMGRTSTHPQVRSDKLVRLATRLGNVHSQVGNVEEAHRWLLQAIDIAGGSADEEVGQNNSSRQGTFRNAILSGTAHSLPSPSAESQEAKQALAESTDAAPVRAVSAETPPSPALTRSLVSCLLALSALHAQPHDRSRLEKALHFQASALRLTRIESSRLALTDKSVVERNSLAAHLHSLWLSHHDALSCLHIAETTYGLGQTSSLSSTVQSILGAVGLRATRLESSQHSLAWIDEAQQKDQDVLKQLAKTTTRRRTDPLELLARWRDTPIEIQTPCSRLLRDSARLLEATTEMQSALRKTPVSKGQQQT